MTDKLLSTFDSYTVNRITYNITYPHSERFDNADIPVRLDKKSDLILINIDPPTKRDGNNSHKSKIKKAIKYINGHLTTNLSLDDVAEHVNLSPCYFSKLFKKQQGIGFNLYVNQQRMKQAKLLLDMPELSIATVAKNLGFSQTSYFCRLFRQIYQITPQTYRNQH